MSASAPDDHKPNGFDHGLADGSIVPPLPIENDASARRIIHAAAAKFSMLGYKATTYRAVARMAGVSHGLVRYHFQSKQELWQTVMSRGLAEYIRHLDEEIGTLPLRSSDAASKLKLIIAALIRFIAKHPEIPQMLTREPTHGSKHLKASIDRYLRAHYDLVTGLIREGQAEGTVRNGDVDHLFYIFTNATQLYTIPYEFKQLTGRDAFDPVEVELRISTIIDLIIL